MRVLVHGKTRTLTTLPPEYMHVHVCIGWACNNQLGFNTSVNVHVCHVRIIHLYTCTDDAFTHVLEQVLKHLTWGLQNDTGLTCQSLT